MSAEIEEIKVEGDEAPADIKGVWGYSDQRGGLYGWSPNEPFPGYLMMSGAKPFMSEKEYKDAIAAAKENDTKGRTRERNTYRTPRSAAAQK